MTNSNKKPIAWLHTLDNTEGIEGNKPIRMLSFFEATPFGVPGVDHDESFAVTSIPLYSVEDEAILCDESSSHADSCLCKVIESVHRIPCELVLLSPALFQTCRDRIYAWSRPEDVKPIISELRIVGVPARCCDMLIGTQYALMPKDCDKSVVK